MRRTENANGTTANRSWRFFTTHAQLLLVLSRNPEVRVVELAEAVHLTERATYRILADLQQDGYVTRERIGRRNRYSVNWSLPLGDLGLEAMVRDLLTLVSGDGRLDVGTGALSDRHRSPDAVVTFGGSPTPGIHTYPSTSLTKGELWHGSVANGTPADASGGRRRQM